MHLRWRLGALMDERSLWSADQHEELLFAIEGLVRQSGPSMKQQGSAQGLQPLAEAIPAVKALVEAS